MVLLMVVGIYKWPHSPIKQVQNGFQDKQGTRFTAEGIPLV